VVERVVEPYGLVSKRGTWYLLAAAGGTRRVYRVSRIENAEVLPERFERPPDFDLEAAWAESVTSYRDHDVLRACARVRPQAQARFARVCGDWVLARRPDGVWEVDMPNLEAAAGYIAVFGDEIEVLSPEALRQILANIGGQLVATYRPAH
jgi:predicted DNA-binding transcriptional regulator YafY